ncbi:Adaptive-response sensory-kinase SasA [subsurface metagenome]
MKGSYPRNISIIAVVFIFLILFLAVVNLYISLQFRNEFVIYDQNKIISIATLCSDYLNKYSDKSELYYFFKRIGSAFDLDRIIITDTLGNRIFDSGMLPLELSLSENKIDFTDDFKRLPEPGEVIQNNDRFIYLNPEPHFYFYTSLIYSYSIMFDKIFRWHIFYITISLLFIGFLGIFLIRNLFLPMRYVTNLAKDMGIQTKKEDFVSETFNEIFKKMKLKEETLVEFSSYIAHEFRNSIGAISGLARLVEKGKKPASDIVNECRAMEDLITRLLEYSRPLTVISASVDVKQLIDDAVVRAAIPKRIEVRKKIKTDILQFIGDSELLLVAITNLLKNSIDSIRKKGFIEVAVSGDNDFIFISVTDNGSGIDESDIDKVFNPFYSKKEQGMGLGLAYVKKIMEIHNGRVELESKKGGGAKFTLIFPVEE